MTADTPTIQSILDRVYSKEKTVGKIDHVKFEAFVRSIVNGDTLIDFIAFSATTGPKDEDCILIYILTNGKLVKATVDKNGFNASSAYLKQIIGVNKSLQETEKGNNAVISVEFPQGRFGLTYPVSVTGIDNFFQKVDKAVREQKG